jgi:DNA adenine methylase
MAKVKHKRNQKYHFSPLRYPGGKTFLFSLFERMMNENKMSNVTYVEPFAGGAGAALTLLLLEKVDKIVINDLDKAIYSFWKSAIFDSERFIKKIHSTPITIKEWRKQKAIYSNVRAKCLDRGFATFFLNRTNVSGILNGGPIGGFNQKGKWKIDARFNKDSLAERIRRIAQYRNRIVVCNEDGVKLIHNYLNKVNTFIYLDPPYYEKGATLYLNHYKKDDHEILAKQLNNNPDAFWLLTYDNKDEIRSLYTKRRITNYLLNYNAYESRKGEELLILSDAFAFSC